GFDGLAIVLGDAFAEIEVDGTTVAAGGAAALPVVARRTAAAGLRGFEWAVGVPGSVGGAVRMNAGGHGSDMAAGLAGGRAARRRPRVRHGRRSRRGPRRRPRHRRRWGGVRRRPQPELPALVHRP